MALTDSLIGFWRLAEASGNALDAHDSLDLTDENGVGTNGTGAREFLRASSQDFVHATSAALECGDIDFTVSELDFCHIISAIFGNIELNDIYGSKAFTLYRERLNSKCTYIMLITNTHNAYTSPCKYST